ncbi:MAG: small nuclear ribonucleoprotein [Candidatus Bathyarchaeota archaeon]|jgi:U6 snRNA-associated Sm-like protein LSm6
MSNDLSKMLHHNISVGLRKGLQYTGKLTSFDNHWNMVLEDAKEIVNGKLTANYGTIILRGNSILHIEDLKI